MILSRVIGCEVMCISPMIGISTEGILRTNLLSLCLVPMFAKLVAFRCWEGDKLIIELFDLQISSGVDRHQIQIVIDREADIIHFEGKTYERVYP